jgi:hypothetical protein
LFVRAKPALLELIFGAERLGFPKEFYHLEFPQQQPYLTF